MPLLFGTHSAGRPGRLRTRVLVGGALVVAGSAFASAPAPAAFSKAPPDVSVTRLASKSATGASGDFNSFSPSISDGCTVVAFTSGASNLTASPPADALQVFARMRGAKRILPASVNAAGNPANAPAAIEDVSGNGRFVLFGSSATNLVGADTFGEYQMYVHNLVTGRTRLVTVNGSGEASNGRNGWATISADGRYVAFRSFGSNLVPDDTNGTADIFVRDLREHTTTRASLALDGGQLSSSSDEPVLSADGRFIAFRSYADLVPADTNGEADVYRVARSGRHLTLVSANKDGAAISGIGPSISATGRYVVFQGDASLMRHDVRTGSNVALSIGYDGDPVYSYHQVISGDGDRVAYVSDDDLLVRRDTNGQADVFLTTISTGRTVLATQSTRGDVSNGWTEEAAISGNGWCVAFSSDATNLGPKIDPEVTNIYLRRLAH
jgi:Tol biopolymer transport system component